MSEVDRLKAQVGILCVDLEKEHERVRVLSATLGAMLRDLAGEIDAHQHRASLPVVCLGDLAAKWNRRCAELALLEIKP